MDMKIENYVYTNGTAKMKIEAHIIDSLERQRGVLETELDAVVQREKDYRRTLEITKDNIAAAGRKINDLQDEISALEEYLNDFRRNSDVSITED